MPPRPRVLLVGRTRYRLPLRGGLARKFAALEERLQLRVLASAPDGAPVRQGPFRLARPVRPRILDGLVYYLRLPGRIARELRRHEPEAVLADGPEEALSALAARALTGTRVPVVVEVHGDWRTATRLYGSRLRRLASPLHDRLVAFVLRRVDAVRTLSPFTTKLVREHGVEPVASFPAFVDVDTFLAEPPAPLPSRPQALFVGVLERYKGVDVLVEAWRRAAPRLPGARLRIVGDGPLRPLVEELLTELPEQVSWDAGLPQAEVSHALDESSLLVMSSRSEGLPRIAMEALGRARPVVGTRAGGIPDLISSGLNGLLVEPEDPDALAEALVTLVTTDGLLQALSQSCRDSVRPWLLGPEEFARETLALVEAAALREPES